jgi:deazaflavin-dependent oxidoreductase (nitroreductase family)
MFSQKECAMKAVRLISLIARVALMVTLGLGLVYWIAQVLAWGWLLVLLVQIGFPNIHELFGIFGVLGLFILGSVAVFTKGNRLLGMGGITYALLVPAFGMTQTLILVGNLHWLIRAAHLLVGIGAMMLAIRIEKHYQHLKLKKEGVSSKKPLGKPYPPIVVRIARLATTAHVALYRLTSGKLGGTILGLPVLLLTTIGRKSGKQHTTPVAYFPHGDGYMIVASNQGQGKLPNWWLNMRESKQAQIEIGRKRMRVSAQQTSPQERQRLWPSVVARLSNYERYQQSTSYPIPLILLHPEEVL